MRFQGARGFSGIWQRFLVPSDIWLRLHPEWEVIVIHKEVSDRRWFYTSIAWYAQGSPQCRTFDLSNKRYDCTCCERPVILALVASQSVDVNHDAWNSKGHSGRIRQECRGTTTLTHEAETICFPKVYIICHGMCHYVCKTTCESETPSPWPLMLSSSCRSTSLRITVRQLHEISPLLMQDHDQCPGYFNK